MFGSSANRHPLQCSHRTYKSRRHAGLQLEQLEPRTLLSAGPVGAAVAPALSVAKSGGLWPFPSAYAPAQVRHSYGFDPIAGNGSGPNHAVADGFHGTS